MWLEIISKVDNVWKWYQKEDSHRDYHKQCHEIVYQCMQRVLNASKAANKSNIVMMKPDQRCDGRIIHIAARI